jgi:hypothetical protein
MASDLARLRTGRAALGMRSLLVSKDTVLSFGFRFIRVAAKVGLAVFRRLLSIRRISAAAQTPTIAP